MIDARTNDHHSPLPLEGLPANALVLRDLGFFSLASLSEIDHGLPERRFFVTKWLVPTALYTQSGHRLVLQGVLPMQVGQVREMGVLLGRGKQRVKARLTLVRVPEDVAEERRARLRQHVLDTQGHEPSTDGLYLAGWLILLTNLPRRLASAAEVIVLMRLRWQIEWFFRLWKDGGKIDEWRSHKPFRILCEFYAKLCAMVMQQALLQDACWDEPYRSLFKAAAALRREANRLMVAFFEGTLAHTLSSVLRCLRSGSKLTRRARHPSTAQLLLEGLDWRLDLLS